MSVGLAGPLTCRAHLFIQDIISELILSKVMFGSNQVFLKKNYFYLKVSINRFYKKTVWGCLEPGF